MSKEDRKAKTAASSVAGASAGTAVLALGLAMPIGPLRSAFVYASPVITVLSRAGWVWLANTIVTHLNRRNIYSALAAARAHKEAAMADPHCSDEHRADLQKRYESLSTLYMEAVTADARRVSVSLRSFEPDA